MEEMKNEQVTEQENAFLNFDDAAEKAREEAEKMAKIEADKRLPPDPEAILEVRHLKKHFVLKIVPSSRILP